MTTIYLVETGEYSDRKVVLAFSDERKAIDFTTTYARNSARYFSIELDADVPNLDGLTMYRCRVLPGGEIYADGYSDEDGVPINFDDIFLSEPKIIYGHSYKGNYFRVEGWFRDAEHATKVTAEKYAKHIYEHPESQID